MRDVLLLVRRVAGALAAAGVLAVLTATPAAAHTVAGSGATDFRTVITGIVPAAPAGLSVSVVENGQRLELVNHTGRTVYVLGYGNERYLRVTPTGVDENLRSTATYLNATGLVSIPPVPAGVDNIGERWRHLSDTPVAIWHDHRVHWMGTTLPPDVSPAVHQVQHVDDWQVLLEVSGRQLTINGRLDWVPGPSSAPWWLLSAALLASAGLFAWRSRLGLAAVLTALTVSDVLHNVGTSLDQAGSSLASALVAYPLVDAGWAAALVGAGLLVAGRLRPGRILAVCWGAWAGLTGGLVHTDLFHDSAAPFAWSMPVARTLTAIELGVGAAVVLAAGRRLALDRADRGAADPVAEPAAAPVG